MSADCTLMCRERKQSYLNEFLGKSSMMSMFSDMSMVSLFSYGNCIYNPGRIIQKYGIDMRPIGVCYRVVSHGKFDDEGEDKKGNEVNNKEVITLGVTSTQVKQKKSQSILV